MASNASQPTQFVVMDASVWASTLLPNDSNHALASNWIRQYVNNGGSFVAPALLVVEIAGTIARITQNLSVTRGAISQLYSLPHMQLVPMDQAIIDESADIAANFRLKGADCFYVAIAKQLGIPLVTFDGEQLTRPASIITTIHP